MQARRAQQAATPGTIAAADGQPRPPPAQAPMQAPVLGRQQCPLNLTHDTASLDVHAAAVFGWTIRPGTTFYD